MVLLAVMAMAAMLDGPLKMGPPVQPVRCDIGPVERTFGGAPWRVYGCSDPSKLAIVAGQGNPATPYWFMVVRDGEGYTVTGEGAGNEAGAVAALAQIKQLTPDQITALFADARK